MKLSQLEQVIEVANTGSISQAATNLYLSQSNISLSIKHLEDEIGSKLFHRTPTGMIPTITGVEFIERAKEILMQLDALGYICRANESRLTQKLVIASVGLRVLDFEIAEIVQKYKQVHMIIKHITACGTQLLDCIAENKAEIGFCIIDTFTKQMMLRQVSARKLEYHTIGEVPTGIYVGRNNPRFSDSDTVVDFEKIKNIPILKTDGREFYGPSLQERVFSELGIPLNPSSEIIIDNPGIMRSLLTLMDTYHISSYPMNKTLYDYEVTHNDMRFIPFPPDTIKSELGYIQRGNSIRSPLADEILDNIKRRFTV